MTIHPDEGDPRPDLILDVAIIGAGAAGCFAAASIPVEAALTAAVFEKGSRPLQKVKVSGGGRCNVTHALFDVPELVKRYPRGTALLRKSLHHFSPADTVAWFAARGVVLKTESDGRMFPVTDNSQTIIDCLLSQLEQSGIKIHYSCSLVGLRRNADAWELHFSDKRIYSARAVLIATGSASQGGIAEIIAALGHSIYPPVPSLFTFNLPKHPITALMGVSVAFATVRIEGTKIRESGPLLITHWGMSGPAVLRASAWGAEVLAEKGYTFRAIVSWLGSYSEDGVRGMLGDMRHTHGSSAIGSRAVSTELPKRLWAYVLERCGIKPETRWGELSAAGAKQLFTALTADPYEVRGKTTFKEEFVTAGGVDVREIHPQTMESRVQNGLYFAGEVLNVDGITGGFNFQHAWGSGWLAANHLVDSFSR